MEVRLKGYLFGLAAVVIWTGFILVSRIGGLSDLSAADVIFIRYLTCCALVAPIWWFRYRFQLFSFKLFILSLIGGLAYALCTFNGFQWAPASHASILLPGLMPLFIILFGHFISREHVSGRRYLGIGLITVGVAALFIQQISSGGSYLKGDLSLVGGSICWAVFSVLIKRWQITPWQVTVSLAVYTTLIYVPIYLLFMEPNLNIELWQDFALQAFYQGVLATIVQMILYVRAIQLIGPSSMGAMMAMVPVLAGISAILILGEVVTPEIVAGLGLVSIGAFYASGIRFQGFHFTRHQRSQVFNTANSGD